MYEEPDPSQATAVFEFVQGQFGEGQGALKGNEFGSPVTVEYKFIDNPQCENPQRAALFPPASVERQVRRVRAEKAAIVVATMTFPGDVGRMSTSSGSAELSGNACMAVAGFVPEVGHTYVIAQQQLNYALCKFIVTDKATGAPPPGLRLNDNFRCPARK